MPEVADFIHQQTLYQLLHRSAVRDPGKLAVIAGDTRWTYQRWAEQVEGMAEGLRERGVTSGERAAIVSRNSLDYASLIFALAAINVVAVPVNFMLTAEEMRYIFSHAGVSSVFAGREFLGVVDDAVGSTPVARYVMDDTGQPADNRWQPLSAVVRSVKDFQPSLVDSQALAQILYTSGTESRPKGVMLTHANLISEYVSTIIDGGFTADDVVLHALPFYHSAQQHVFLGPYTYLGATHVIVDQPRPDIVLPLIARERVTEFFAPPTVWINLLRSPLFDHTDLSTLTKGHYGAAIMPREVLVELARRLPHTRFWNFYGQTEVAPLATVLKPEDQLRKLGSAGKPALNVETRILDEDGRAVPPGVVGEICHRTPHAMQGYYRDPEKTAEAFQFGWFHSGDLGVMDTDGYLTVVDRKKDMIKTGGENVSSREVEEVMYQHPAVSEVAVIGIPDAYWIEAVAAVVVTRPGMTVTDDELIRFCRDRLAGYKVPKQVRFMTALPKNPSGKILKRELRQVWDHPTADEA
ncbi:Long-chain-fatty-acid--CoA ligase [Sulfobacillus acidophilus DSM 10332]|uniref:Long-chain-fatty-acid--CoA ligase n=1 Tax=Sulfobacillus acidophilus (strain ATCC 700253 / DSM 10332 / NAL) TaxID=679936 RepID=G8TT81_SULAD|nr:Long-chain-fatty-acid--CoA ligase [Sulfobacillus acidophilus DSM 10332]